MKLTNTLRDAFVRAALNDVPQVNYDALYREYLQKTALEIMHPKLRAVYDDKDLRGFIETTWVWHDATNALSSCYIVTDKHKHVIDITKINAMEMNAEARKQATMIEELKSKLRAAAYSCTTRKALAELLPEFEKYLLAEQETTRNLPAVANLVSDFVKAGWPKGKKP